jgi:two-component system chemotaxis response regulator CheB
VSLKKIGVIVVDDSALMRKIISDMINEENDMEVIDTARNGLDLLEKLKVKDADVITLDIEMPIMDGITTIDELKKKNNKIPIIILSSVAQEGMDITLRCLEKGALDFVSKPSGSISLDIRKVKENLVNKVREASLKIKKENSVEMQSGQKRISVKMIENKCIKSGKIKAIVIGASTGGPKALYSLISSLPSRMGMPIFVVQHMPKGFTKAFADRLDANSKIHVVEASDNETIKNDTVYIAPGGFHMEISKNNTISLNKDEPIWGVRPAVDKLFISATKVYGSGLISVVLTGMGKDGAQGTVEIKKAGGITISEHESTCTIYGMPKAAYETGMVDKVVPLDDIAKEVVNILDL